MITLLTIANIILTASGLTYDTAWASQYAQVPTDRTLEFQQDRGWLPQDLSDYTVFVATTLFCGISEDGYKTGYIRPILEDGPGSWERFAVMDCAGHADTVENFFRPNNIQVEVDYYTAFRWETIERGIEVDIIWLE